MNSRSDNNNFLTSPHICRPAIQEQGNTKYEFTSPQMVQNTLPTPYTLNQNKLDHMSSLGREHSDVNDCSLVENSMLNHHNQQRHQRLSNRSIVDPNVSSSIMEANSSQVLNDSDHSINGMFPTSARSSTSSQNIGMILTSNHNTSSSSAIAGATASMVSHTSSTAKTTLTPQDGSAPASTAVGSSSSVPSADPNAHPIASPVLPDINEQPSSVLHFGNFANELLLASPEQFKEFLMESPAGLNFWQQRNTPAKTPLKFVTNNNTILSQQPLNNGFPNTITSPLQNIDVNLMFNSGSASKSSLSPPRKQMSLTPYGRKILNEMGTPFTKMLQPISSNNSALVDFHRARKHNLQSTPTSKPSLRNDSPGSRIYGSSPTTIQLHSSGVKCSPGRNLNIDDKLFHLQGSPTPKLSVNKSDKLQLDGGLELPRMGSFREGLFVPSLSAPDGKHSLTGSTSRRNSSTITSHETSSFTSEKVRKPKLNRKGNKNKSKTSQIMTKQRFQIIMTDTTSFNSDNGVSSNNSNKLKRCNSVIVSGENKKKKKKKSSSFTSCNTLPHSQ